MIKTIQNSTILKNELAQIAIGTGLLAAASQISIPLQPVPITMQTAAVLLIGLFYSHKTAIKTVLTYLAVGAMGAPVFSNFGGGFTHFLLPKAGYLFGFLACVAIMTAYREKVARDTFATQVIACLLGSVAMYAVGISWLSMYVGVEKAFMFGFVPFIIPGIIKGLIVAYATKQIKSSAWR
jgi:biotin transport system substrate-specific component